MGIPFRGRDVVFSMSLRKTVAGITAEDGKDEEILHSINRKMVEFKCFFSIEIVSVFFSF